MVKLKNLISKFRRHSFDLDHPDTVTHGGIFIEGVPVQYTIYTCTACGKTLMLSLEDMKKLPFSMSHGCSGKKKDG